MNDFTAIDIEYLRPSRTIETIIVSNKKTSKIYYVYNYDGNSYWVFENFLGLIQFFTEGKDCKFHLKTETELDDFFYTVKLK